MSRWLLGALSVAFVVGGDVKVGWEKPNEAPPAMLSPVLLLANYHHQVNIPIREAGSNTTSTREFRVPLDLASPPVTWVCPVLGIGVDTDACGNLAREIEPAIFRERFSVASANLQTAISMAKNTSESVALAAKLYNDTLHFARGIPWRSAADGSGVNEALFHQQRDYPFRRNTAALAEMWASGAMQEIHSKPYKVPMNTLAAPVGDFRRRGQPFIAQRSKLRLDLEQTAYLTTRGLLPPRLGWPMVQGFLDVLASAGPGDASDFFLLSNDHFQKIGRFFQTLVYEAPPLPAAHSALAQPALNPAVNFALAERMFAESDPQLVVIDDLLSPAALEALLAYCLESTLYFETKQGYAAATLDEGLSNSQILLKVIDELRTALPHIIGQQGLENAWVFKYDNDGADGDGTQGRGRRVGTQLHADNALINLNFWLTPDDANLDPESGGLVVFSNAPPPEWGFLDYNEDSLPMRERMRNFIAGSQNVTIPYKQNRLVMFHSKLFHQTDAHFFKPGYTNRRINLTLLFGKPEVDASLQKAHA